MRQVHLCDRAVRPAAATILVLLAACAGPSDYASSERAAAGRDALEPGPVISMSAQARGRDTVVCAEPRPACPAMSGAEVCLQGRGGTWDLLRRGLFQICDGFRAGKLSEQEYRAGLVAYPALVAQVAALDFLDQPRFGGPMSAEARTVGGWLNANPALPALCRSLPTEQWLSTATAASVPVAVACSFTINMAAKE